MKIEDIKPSYMVMFDEKSRVRYAPDGAATGAAANAGASEADGDQGAAADAANEGAAAGDQAAAGNADADKGGKATDDWRSGIADEKLRDYASKFTSIEDLAKTAHSLRVKLSTAVNAPGEDASDEEVAAYREKMGVPATPDAYKMPEIEGYEQTESDKAYQGAMSSVLHKHNIPTAAAQELAAAHIAFLQTQSADAAAQMKKADEEYQSTAEAQMRKEWGKDYQANLKYAEEAAKIHFDDDVGAMELKNGQLLGSHPAFIKGMAAIGRMSGEGVIHVDQGSADTLMEQADAARAKREEARKRGDNAAMQRYDQEERDILAKVYGKKG
jgi:hypothetical protein